MARKIEEKRLREIFKRIGDIGEVKHTMVFQEFMKELGFDDLIPSYGGV